MSKFALRPAKSGGYVVELDGADISNTVTGVDLSVEPGHMPVVRLDVAAFEVDVDTDDAKVLLLPGARELLIKFGWTPPAEDES